MLKKVVLRKQSRPSLSKLMDDLVRETRLPMSRLTVMAKDPYRMDTPANHRNGVWFRDQLDRCGLLQRARPIHLRGIHYAIVALGARKVRLPAMEGGQRLVCMSCGRPGKCKCGVGKRWETRPAGFYENNDKCWQWLQNSASKAARWLGYVPFEQIIDNKNDEPIIRIRQQGEPTYCNVSMRAHVSPLDDDDFVPTASVSNLDVPQPYRIVLVGEKTSLGDVLEPISNRYGTDLYLVGGQMTDTLIATIARTGQQDGRPCIVFSLTDCDPSGYDIATSVGHKLRAMRDKEYPDLQYAWKHIALTPEQAKELDLPDSPLKESEQASKKNKAWVEAFDIEQVEIDALATLQPDMLREIVEDEIKPYFDKKLDNAVAAARTNWQCEVQQAFDAQVEKLESGETELPKGEPWLDVDELKREALALIAEARDKLSTIDEQYASVEFEAPEPELPEPNVRGSMADLPIHTSMTLREHIEHMRARKSFDADE